MNSRAATEYQPAVPARFTDRERPGAIPLWGRERISWYDLLAFAAPLFRFVRFQFVGFLLGTDLILWFAFPFVVISKGRLLDAALPRRFLLLGFLWLLGQVLTDIVRATPLEELARGWSIIGATLADFVILYVLLSDNRRRIILYALAIALGTCAEYFLNPYGYSLTEPWKFGVGPAITGIIVLLATYCYARGLRFVCAGLLLFTGLLNVFMLSRAAGLVCVLAASFVGSQALLPQGTKRSAAHTLMLPVAILLATFAIARTYACAANHGLLGAKARLQYQSQSSGSFGVLVGGRGDSLASIRAIMDSPIIGHGSWPTDSTYTLYLAHLMASLGYRNSPAGAAIKRYGGLIPAHSHLLGAWVQAGVAGAIFWFWVYSLTIRGLYALYTAGEPLTPLIAYFAFLLGWDVLFSPYGFDRRFLTTYYVILLMFVLNKEANHALRLGRYHFIQSGAIPGTNDSLGARAKLS
jgi:hypothetical protein